MFYNIQPFLFPCIRVDQQGWLPQRKGIGHSLVLCATAGKFRVIYGHQHIRLLDDPPIGHKLCVRCLLIVYTGKVGAVRQHIGAIEAPNLCRPISLDLLFNIAAVLNVEPAKLLTFRE